MNKFPLPAAKHSGFMFSLLIVQFCSWRFLAPTWGFYLCCFFLDALSLNLVWLAPSTHPGLSSNVNSERPPLPRQSKSDISTCQVRAFATHNFISSQFSSVPQVTLWVSSCLLFPVPILEIKEMKAQQVERGRVAERDGRVYLSQNRAHHMFRKDLVTEGTCPFLQARSKMSCKLRGSTDPHDKDCSNTATKSMPQREGK